MKPTRRNFLHSLGLGLLSLPLLKSCKEGSVTPSEANITDVRVMNGPLVLSTWNHKVANSKALEVLMRKDVDMLSALEAGINHVENDENDQSVGYGGRPDRGGHVTLDACIMNSEGGSGSVTYVQGVKNPISLARKVMEHTPHVMLSGDGATKFAQEMGMPIENLLTESTIRQYEQWLKNSEYKPIINIENHDTIGMIVMDHQQNIAGGCSTSGMAYKMEGRVGDSPIIGAGLYVDNEIGAATATGVGELVMKTLGAFLIVELMRQKHSAQDACEIAVRRIIDRYNVENQQVGFLAISKTGEIGAFSIFPGFIYTLTNEGQNTVIESLSHYD